MTGYDVLYVEKTGGAVVLGKKAYTFATGSTGAGGYLYGDATSKGWHDVSFEHVVGVGLSLPTGNPGKTYPTTIFRATGTVIGGATPTGDLRGEGTGFVGIGNSNPYNFQKDTDYSGALYAIYRGTQDFSGKIGVGTTMGAIAASGYYDGNFKSKDIHEFVNSFTPNTGDLSVIPTGSGIYLRSNRVGVRNAIVSRAGNTLTTPQALRADALVSGQRISITDISGNVVADNFRNYTNPSFTLTHDQNVDIFGSYRKNFGIRNEIIGYDTGVHTSQVNLYGNTLSIRDIYVQASGKLEKNQSTGNLTMPNTGGMSAADAKNAIKGFNGQLIAESGCTGYIAVQAFWNEDMANCEPHQMGVWAGNSGNFVANRKSYLGSYELPRKPSFTVQFYPNDASAANVNFSSGTWFEFASSSRVGRDSQRFRVGGEEGYRLENPLEEYAQYLRRYGHVAIKSGDLVVSGKDAGGFYANTYSGSGDGHRITAPNGNVYLVSGDDPGDFCYCTLQEVVSNGNTSTTDIYMNGSSRFYINSYISHVGDANSYFGFPDNDQFALVAGGQTRMHFTTDGATVYDPLGKSAVEIGKGGYSLQSESSSIISAYNSVINSTGCLIGAGSGHQISGDYDVIAGGVTNNISGGDFNFIGGGSGIDVTGADYCSSLGGYNNDIKSSDYSVIAGGYDNLVSGAGAAGAVVGGGFSNIIKAGSAVIAGGQSNTVHEGGNYSFIGAGGSNIIRGQNNVIAGGINQEMSGDMAVIIGGSDNKVEADRGVVGGNHSYVQEWHTGAFVFSDSSATHALSTGADTLNLHFAEGVYVESTSGLYVNGNAVSTGSAGGSDTFGTVSARGNTTTTSIGVQGQYLSGVSGVFESVDITGTATLTVTGSVQGTGIGNRITNNHVPYLLSGDVTISELGLGTAATKDVGISNNNVIQANNTLVDNDFLRIDGTQVEGRSASEVLSDIGGQASLTFGISNTNAVKIDSASVADDEYARFTANGLESRSTSEVKSDIGLSANDSPTFNGLIVTGAAGISGGANFIGTGLGQRITAADGKPYLVSGDSPADSNSFVTGATFGTSDGVLTLKRNDSLADVTVDLDGRFTDNAFADAMNQGVASGDSPTFNSVDITGTSTLTVTGSVQGTGIGNRITNNHVPYLLSGDVTTSSLGLGTAATKDVGISNNNVIQANNTLVDNDFLRVDGTQVEGRSASEVLSDIGGQASLTFGISNTNAVKIDSASVADDEYARFTADGLESRSTSEVLSDIGAQASLTFGISNTNAVKIDSASVADDEYARFTSNGLESRSTSEVKSDIGLSANDSPTFNGLIVTGAAGISGGANFLGTGVGNRITAENGKVYLVSGDVESDTNNYLDSATFNTANGVLTLGREGLSDVTVDLDGRFTDNTHADAMNQGVATTDSPTFNGLKSTGAAGISGGANFIGTGIGNRLTAENGKPYLISGDVTTSELGLGTAATKDVGISNNNVIQANNTLVDNDFLRIDGTQVEGRSASEVLSDIGGQASLTFGISNTNAVKIDSASVADDEYARFTSAGLESRSTSEVLSDIGGVADGGSPTFNSIYLQNTIFHDGDTDTRIDVSADTIQLATAGTTALTVASNSNVGIGTAVPNAAYKLHTQGLNYATGMVVGGGIAGYTPSENGLIVEGKAAVGYYSTVSTLGVYGGASVGTSYISTAAPSNGLIVQGDVGIGNNAPQTELDVSGAIKGGFNLTAKSSDFTLGAGHNGTFFNGTSTSFDRITVSSDLGAGFNASLMHSGSNVEITGSSSMIINGITNGIVTLASGYQPASIVRLATNTYAVFGNLT